MNIKKQLKKNANIGYFAFNKKARGEGLNYISQEFESIQQEINQITSEYRLGANKLTQLPEHVLDIGERLSNKINNLVLDFSQKKYQQALTNFTKSIERNHKKELIEQFGQDYAEALRTLVETISSSLGKNAPKYKLIIELFNDQDADLIKKVFTYIGHTFKIIENQNSRNMQVIQDHKLNKTDVDMLWVANYKDLFKFAQFPMQSKYNDIEELPDEDVLSYNELSLTASEKSALKSIYDEWKQVKQQIDKYNDVLSKVINAIVDVENDNKHFYNKQIEMFQSVFDYIRALKKMIQMYIDEGNPEKEFYGMVGLSFKDAIYKIDNWVYLLYTMFPAYTKIDELKSLPKSVSNKPPTTWENEIAWDQSDDEAEFFDLGNEYENGNRSGIEEDGKGEVIFRDKSLKPQLSIGPNSISNSVRASKNIKNKKFAK